MVKINERLAKEFQVNINQVNSMIELLDDGNTVPFIARYRKEKTGGLDDIILRNMAERLTYLRNLKERKEDVIRIIGEQEKLTEDLKLQIEKCETLTEVEDIYRPFKPKKRTRATIAVEKGLQLLADMILGGEFKGSLEEYVNEFISEEKEVRTISEALNGAKDIIAEIISDEAQYRKWIRES